MISGGQNGRKFVRITTKKRTISPHVNNLNSLRITYLRPLKHGLSCVVYTVFLFRLDSYTTAHTFAYVTIVHVVLNTSRPTELFLIHNVSLTVSLSRQQ